MDPGGVNSRPKPTRLMHHLLKYLVVGSCDFRFGGLITDLVQRTSTAAANQILLLFSFPLMKYVLRHVKNGSFFQNTVLTLSLLPYIKLYECNFTNLIGATKQTLISWMLEICRTIDLEGAFARKET